MDGAVKRHEITARDFSPRVFKSSLFTQGMDFPLGFKLRERYVYDYELEFFIDSRGSMIIDDKNYTIKKGDVVFRKPGQYTQGIMPYCCYFICFDLTGSTGKNPDTYDIYSQQEFQDDYINPIIDSIPPVFHPSSDQAYHRLFESVLDAYLNKDEYSELLQKTRVLEILCQLYRDVQDSAENKSVPFSSHYTTVRKVTEYMEKNFAKKINLLKLSEQTGLSPNYLHKVFKETMKLTPNEYLTGLRLSKAKEMLVKTNIPVFEVALLSGFDNIPYFSYVFRKHTWMSPAEFRKKHNYAG